MDLKKIFFTTEERILQDYLLSSFCNN